MGEHNIEKLPAWARYEWQILTNRVRSLEQALAIATGKAARSSTGLVVVDRYSNYPIPLPDHSTIEFTLPTGKIQVRLGDKKLDISSVSGCLEVHPQAANRISCDVEKY